ncbi:hypothetical protein Pst134EA_026808 [Puccinia striiformis f. sp. tritici]|uniref:hypothetical protein n=1 Tax=Puccinia striiformis f. sp. tritici TaxID=168172 RepID=UPI0020086DF9|nr:hypothetical protein Pst134EA_026808 [Puccinia striiformis f. sp. tritici]KAH9450099.1 hypothetical protein Pst134EA_026808 [Puccinia striiformis f. sp. tritici]
MATTTNNRQTRHITHPEFTENVIWNDRAIDSIRSTCSCLSGSLSGIIGLTNFSGLGFYLTSFTITNLIILLVNYLKILLGYSLIQSNKNKSKLQNLTENLKFTYSFWVAGLIDNCFGFILCELAYLHFSRFLCLLSIIPTLTLCPFNTF